ncbi:hypothetical protein LIER_15475 [Lithospermum erythrorhizon]|uniref:Uncharacterized protein n=1 Tax=Lithospermum erythrorhizon TaxID=34254 RepID=A0AAV3Q504_LITER
MATNKKSKTGEIHWDEMSIGFIPFKKPGSDLLQNCDLPPPLKTISGPDFAVQSSPNKLFTGQEGEECKSCISRNEPEGERIEVLKALRLSQTRARDAERKAALMSKEKECISVMFLQESLQLMAYKQWVKMLEFQVSSLNMQEKKQYVTKLEDDKNFTLLVAIAFCLGAGMGYAFRWVYIV